MTPKTGDTVRFLNTTGGGRIVKITGNIAYVDEDGFETPVLLRECVVVSSAGITPTHGAPVEFKVDEAPQQPPRRQPEPPEDEPEKEIEETATGDVLNVVLGFEPTDIKNLSQSSFEAYLVNDSNYLIDYAVMTRADDDELWTLRRRGVAEPNMQVFAFEFGRTDLPAMDRIAIQMCACKTSGKAFAIKQPVLVETHLDTTRFARLHCFTRNEYFDSPVIALDIVRDDKPLRPQRLPDPEVLKRAMKEKQRADRPVRRKEHAPRPKAGDTIEIDLHATELFDDLRGMSNADILNAQVDRFRSEMDKYLRTPGVRLVFIHGKGNGILREALMKELNHRYKGHDVQDASFREYGFGATQVTIRNTTPHR